MHPDSSGLHDEYNLYCWKNGTDKPEDKHNHLIDAFRYALSKPKNGTYAFKSNGTKDNPFDQDGDLKDPEKQTNNYGYGKRRRSY
jgi:hypothetical protein